MAALIAALALAGAASAIAQTSSPPSPAPSSGSVQSPVTAAPATPTAQQPAAQPPDAPTPAQPPAGSPPPPPGEPPATDPSPAIPPQATPAPAVPSAASPTPTPPKPEVTPEQYLSQAAQVFMNVSQAKLKGGDAKKRMDDLKQHFAQLLSTYKTNGNPFVPPDVPAAADLNIAPKPAPMNWKIAFSDVESDLAGILGGGSVLPASSADVVPVGTVGTVPVTPAPNGSAVAVNPGTVATTPGAPGTAVTPATPGSVQTSGEPGAIATSGAPAEPSSGIVAAPGSTPATAGTVTGQQVGVANAAAVAGAVGVKDLDPNVRVQLEQFRRAIELFFATAVTTPK
jgi:hypothetical protein